MLRPELKEELRLEVADKLDTDRLELVLEGLERAGIKHKRGKEEN